MRAMIVALLVMAALSGCFGGEDEPGEGNGNGGGGNGNGDQPAPMDSDGDGIPDEQDICEGHDDNADADSDGTPDGCDDTPDGEDNGTNEPDPPRDPVTWQVSVGDNSFSPAALTIQAGDTVRWVYEGSNPHTATADNGEFDSGDCPGPSCFHSPIGVDEYEWTSTADNVGDVPYVCEVHVTMTASITVMERYDETPAA